MMQRANVFILTMIVFMGCSSSSSEPVAGGKKRPDRTKVSGVVTLNSDPVEGATVTLHPASESGKIAFGVSDFSGRFTLETYEKADGVVPGEYKITVSKQVAGEPAPQPGPGEPGYSPGPKAVEPKQLMPVKYLDANESDLKVTVGKDPISLLELKLE